MLSARVVLKVSALAVALAGCAAAATITVTPATQYQTIEGFGGFGPMKVWWSGDNATYYTDAWLDLVINDLGLTMLRDVPPSVMEEPNDNADPAVLNLAGFNLDNKPYGDSRFSAHLAFLRAIKQKADASGEPFRLLASWWSPPAWMKQSGVTTNGGYIKDDMYEEFAEMVAGYCKIVQRDCGYLPYAVSPQDEPAFAEPYESCQWTTQGLARVCGLIGRRLASEGIGSVRIVMPEELSSQWASLRAYSGIACSDTSVNRYISTLAFHAYDVDGVGANTLDTTLMKNFYSQLTGRFGKTGWQTETSGYGSDWMLHARNMLVGLKYARLTAWVYWYLADDFIASDGSNVRTKFWYSSKNVFRYVRPGAVTLSVSCSDPSLLTVTFGHAANRTLTVVVLNNSGASATATVTCPQGPASYRLYRTSASENCEDKGTVAASGAITFPAGSVTTLYATGWDMPAVAVSHGRSAPRAAGAGVRKATAAFYGLDGRRLAVHAGNAGITAEVPHVCVGQGPAGSRLLVR